MKVSNQHKYHFPGFLSHKQNFSFIVCQCINAKAEKVPYQANQPVTKSLLRDENHIYFTSENGQEV